MGENFGPWRPQPNFNRPSPNLNPSGPVKPDLCQSVYMKPSTNMAYANGFSPSFGISEAPNLPMGQASEPRGWFYCLPRFRQAFAPCPPSDPEEKLRRETASKPGPELKKFLVVDRSGDQTTLIFSSGEADPVCHLGAWKRSPDEFAGGAEKKRLSEPISFTGAESEMREDTEELDALLYSDDDDSGSSEDDEVTSTGHSPSTMTSSSSDDDDKHEVVASSDGSAKKRKLSAEPKPKAWFESEDDAESSCGNERSFGLREIDFAPASNKRIKKEKIRETVNILQTIIPDGQGKDAIVVLDEAIQYLKTLKVKAEALGLDAL